MKQITCKLFALLMVSVLLCTSALGAVAEETISTIMSAGTTQSFTEEAVSENDLNTILQAGLVATSAINQQPWFFAVVTNQEIMDEIGGSMGFGGAPAGMPAEGAEAPEGMTPPDSAELPANIALPEKGEMPASPTGGSAAKATLGDSPVAIIIYMNEATASPNPSFDCGLACQNMVVAASALGYGTKIISSPTMTLNGDNHDALCEKLGVDPTMSAVAVLLIGKADTDTTASASVRSTMEEKVRFIK